MLFLKVVRLYVLLVYFQVLIRRFPYNDALLYPHYHAVDTLFRLVNKNYIAHI